MEGANIEDKELGEKYHFSCWTEKGNSKKYDPLKGQDKMDRMLGYSWWEIKEENINSRNMVNNLK